MPREEKFRSLHDGVDGREELLESTPPNLRDDALQLYFRCRYSHRECLADLVFTPEQRRITGLELERIQTLRNSFACHEQERISSEFKRIKKLLSRIGVEGNKKPLPPEPSKKEKMRPKFLNHEDDEIMAEIQRLEKLLPNLTRSDRESISPELETIETVRMRYSKEGRKKIARDLNRIESSLSSIMQNGKDENLLECMSRLRKEWTADASARYAEEKKKIELLSKKELAKEPPTRVSWENAERYRRQLKVLQAFHDWSLNETVIVPTEVAPTAVPELSTAPDPGKMDKDCNIRIAQITLKQEIGSTSFTNYQLKKFSLQEVLGTDKTNPLMSKCKDNEIRYFHFPANDMLWVEEVICRYYGEVRGEYNYRKAANYCKRSSNILCRAYWTALQHGNSTDPVHARHMRSHCAKIYSVEDDGTPNASAQNPTPGAVQGTTTLPGTKSTTNFVIFMPFLHWETDSRRRRMAQTMAEVTRKHQKNERLKNPQLVRRPEDRLTDAVEMEMFRIAYGDRSITEPIEKKNQTQANSKKQRSNLENIISKLTFKKGSENSDKPRSKLAQYLFAVAKVYDSMDIEPDLRLLIDHLHHQPPLQPRRTLDQSYHSKLENTARRDQDQVVYRGTKAGDENTRVVMVDQLWLYVLDDRTIISFFPRRWGRNKPDFSGVHRSLRSYLEHLQAGEIQSAYDLALMIMDQCSTVFFDRSKPADARPQVLDIFANAIAQVSEKKSIAFERFWRHLKQLNPKGSPQMDTEAIKIAARIYLDVNPEGDLLRECHDIMDELQMMKSIYHQQLDVARRLSKYLHKFPEREHPGQASLQMMKHVYEQQLELARNFSKALNEIAGGGLLKGPGRNSEMLAAQRESATNGSANGHLNDRASDNDNSNGNGNANHNTSGDGDGNENGSTTGSESCSESYSCIPEKTQQRAADLEADIKYRLGELEDLESSTEEVTGHLNALLELKQQQASIIEAKFALSRADEAVNQGRAIMMFTIVTIIFLPLSFMSSLFGMNAKELSNDQGGVMSIHKQFKYMFSISFGIIFVSLALAFSTWIRGGIWAWNSGYKNFKEKKSNKNALKAAKKIQIDREKRKVNEGEKYSGCDV